MYPSLHVCNEVTCSVRTQIRLRAIKVTTVTKSLYLSPPRAQTGLCETH